MEVADRTAVDRKGGHLARSSDGRLILRESAQCPPDEEQTFQDIQLYRYFNTNNLWINLRALADILAERSGVLGLPLIRNEKPVDPAKPSTPRVYQLETAMGAAIAVIEGAQALRVPYVAVTLAGQAEPAASSGTRRASPVQVAPSVSSSARTSPGFSTVPRWWIEDMQNDRW